MLWHQTLISVCHPLHSLLTQRFELVLAWLSYSAVLMRRRRCCALRQAGTTSTSPAAASHPPPRASHCTAPHRTAVIHAGIYYPPGSLKARLCVEGRDMLYDYCAAKGINHKAVGKLIVSTSEGQLPALRGIHDKGRANGVPGLQMLSAGAHGGGGRTGVTTGAQCNTELGMVGSSCDCSCSISEPHCKLTEDNTFSALTCTTCTAVSRRHSSSCPGSRGCSIGAQPAVRGRVAVAPHRHIRQPCIHGGA